MPPLYYAANYLQISTLKQDCEKFLSRGMHDGISLEIWQVAKSFGNHQVAEVAKSIALQNFGAFCHVESIGKINFEDLKQLLQDKFVNCSGVIKCKAAWIWLVARETPDIDDAKGLINALVASENVDNEDILGGCQTDWDELLEAVEFDKLTFCRNLWEAACRLLWIQPEETKHTSTMSLKECFIVVGGNPLSECKLTVFDFKKKLWYDVETENRELGHRFAICSLGSFLYLSGGTKDQRQFLCFNSETKRWSNEENLPVSREQHNMCTVPVNTIRSEKRKEERKIYVLGGTSQQQPKLKDVHVYNVGTMGWSKVGEVAYAVAAACSTVVERRIYLLGGALVDGERSRSLTDIIQCFDTVSGYSWKMELNLPFKTKSHKMEIVCFESDQLSHEEYVVHEEKIYKLKLDKRKGSLEVAAELSGAPTKGFAVSNFGEKLFIFGGEDNRFRCSREMLQFDIKTKQTVVLPIKTPFEMRDFAHTAIPIPESWVLTEL